MKIPLILPASVAALSVLSASTAHAVTENYYCDTPAVYTGDNKSPVTSTFIIYNYNLDIWSIRHFLSDGTSVFREAQYIIKADSNIEGTSKNRSYSSDATKLSANDSASFPFRFMDVHARAARDPHREQFFEVPLIGNSGSGPIVKIQTWSCWEK